MASKVESNYGRWISSAKVSLEDKAILKAMDQKTKDDAFFQDIEFGTAGMRGLLGPGTNRMNVFTVQKATIAFGMFLLEKFADAKTRGVVISHDNRHLSRQFTLGNRPHSQRDGHQSLHLRFATSDPRTFLCGPLCPRLRGHHDHRLP